jgi:ATP-binding cassette subfamily F protein 3
VGRNGEGKTTLSKVIIDEIPFEGLKKLGHQVKIGYYAQNQDELLNENMTVFEVIDHAATGEIRTKIRDILGSFLFSGETIDKKVKVLSGGERSRLALARLLLEPVNFLVLDEPTNHLDMASRDILKQALLNYDGTVVIVSHDRYFLEGLVSKVYEFRDKKIREHLGGIYEFLARRRIETLRDLEAKKEVKQKQSKSDSDQKRLYEERKELERTIRKIASKVEQCEVRIARLEEQIASMDHQLANPDHISDPALFEEYGKVKKLLESELHIWEELHGEVESWEEKKNSLTL